MNQNRKIFEFWMKHVFVWPNFTHKIKVLHSMGGKFLNALGISIPCTCKRGRFLFQEWRVWNDLCWIMDHHFITNLSKCVVFMNDGPIYYFLGAIDGQMIIHNDEHSHISYHNLLKLKKSYCKSDKRGK
jgi:hypothetical protein